MSKDAAEVLRAARKLIEQPDAWIKGNSAIDKYGHYISPWSKDAVCFCALGAVECATHKLNATYEVDQLARDFLYRAIRTSIADYNDTHTHKQVIGRFDRAIALAEAK